MRIHEVSAGTEPIHRSVFLQPLISAWGASHGWPAQVKTKKSIGTLKHPLLVVIVYGIPIEMLSGSKSTSWL